MTPQEVSDSIVAGGAIMILIMLGALAFGLTMMGAMIFLIWKLIGLANAKTEEAKARTADRRPPPLPPRSM